MDAFTETYQGYYDAIVAYADNRIHNHEMAQDVFMRLYLSGLDTLHGIKPWLFHVARNRIIDYVRMCSYRNHASLDDVDRLTSTSDIAESIVVSQDVQQALKNLAPVHQSILLLHYAYNCTYDEINMILGINWAKQYGQRAKKHMKEVYKP